MNSYGFQERSELRIRKKSKLRSAHQIKSGRDKASRPLYY